MKEASQDISTSKSEDGRVGATISKKTLALYEIASVISSFLIAEWVVLPFAANSKLVAAVPVCLAFVLMLLSHRAWRESARDIGWRFDNFWAAARLLILPTVVVSVAIISIGYAKGSLRFDREQFFQWSMWLPLWGLMQQYVLQGFVNRRAQVIFGRGWPSLLLVAAIFALLHLPNLWLGVATFLGGLVWGYVYQRAPNLPALAISHALMSMMLAMSLPASMLNSLRVGIKYFG